MTGWDRTVAIFLTEAMGVCASVTAVPPAVAVPAVAVLGAGGSEMPNLVAGIATHPGLEVSWAVGTNMANMATHGAEVVHVDDWGGRGDGWGVLKRRGARGKGDSDGHGGGRADSVRGEGTSLTLIRRVVSLPADGAGGGRGLALSFVLLLVLLLVRWDRNRA